MSSPLPGFAFRESHPEYEGIRPIMYRIKRSEPLSYDQGCDALSTKRPGCGATYCQKTLIIFCDGAHTFGIARGLVDPLLSEGSSVDANKMFQIRFFIATLREPVFGQ